MSNILKMFMNSMKRVGVRFGNVLKRPFLVLGRKLRRLGNPDGIFNTVVRDVQKEITAFTKTKPVSLKDYFTIGSYYVLKKLVFAVIIAVVLLIFLYIRYLHPMLVSKFFTKTMIINSYVAFLCQSRAVHPRRCIVWESNR